MGCSGIVLRRLRLLVVVRRVCGGYLPGSGLRLRTVVHF
jgi:hypothetical protein